MTTHKILTIILIISAIFFGVSIFLQNEKTDEVVIPPTANEQAVSTPAAATTTTTSTAEKYIKETFLTTQNYFELPDNLVLSIKKINDSRCPANVNCVRVGNIVATMNIKRGTAFTEDFDLTFGPGNEAVSYTYNGYTIKIKAVTPYKGPSSEILDQKDYRVLIQVSK